MRGVGQALVEFALVVVVLMYLVLGILDGARGFYGYTVATNAAREAARWGAGNDPTLPGWSSGALQAGANLLVGINANDVTLSAEACNVPGAPPPPPLSPSCSSARVASLPYVRVTGSYVFHALTPGIAGMWQAALGHDPTVSLDTTELVG